MTDNGNADSANRIAGACLCGGIEYTCDSPGKPITICHCEQCRRWGGSPWGATAIPFEKFLIAKGEDNLVWFESSNFARRGFCKICGSSLFWHADRHPEWFDTIAISAGSLNKPTKLEVSSHIWCEFKGDYYEINDGIPQVDGDLQE